MIDVSVEMEDVASHFRAAPDDLLEILAMLANGFERVDHLRDWARRLAANHCGSIAHRMVAPALQIIVDELEDAEAEQAAAS